MRRAKLYYLRERVGKRARVRERRYVGPEEVVEAGLLHDPVAQLEAEAAAAEGAVDAEGATAEETTAEAVAAERRSEDAEAPVRGAGRPATRRAEDPSPASPTAGRPADAKE